MVLALLIMFWCVSMTPLGYPVVPEVYCILMTSVECRIFCRSFRVVSDVCVWYLRSCSNDMYSEGGFSPM